MASTRTAMILLCLCAAALWGLWWIPIRWLEGFGLAGAYPGLAMTLGAFPFLLIFYLKQGGEIGRIAILGAAAVGMAVTLYGTALLFSDIVRCVLLFYLAPAWSTLIECSFMGRRWSWRSALAIGVSLLGAVFVFRGEISLYSLNLGDVMALAAGMLWSIGSAIIFAQHKRNPAGLALVACIVAILFGAIFAALTAPMPSADVMLAAVLPALSAGALFFAPILAFTLWAALNLPPATVSFLLTAEIVTGVASGALFLDERFGIPEAFGTALITTGAIIELIAPASRVIKKED